MKTRWGIYLTVPALALGATVLANRPTGAWAHPGHDDPPVAAAPGRPIPSAPISRPPAGARPLPSSETNRFARVSGLAHEFDRTTGQLVEVMTGEAHHQDDGDREESAEFRAIMAGGALQGQAHAFHLLVHRNDETDVRAGTSFLMRSVQMAQPVILHGHVTRDVRAAWGRVRVAANQLNTEVARLPRNWDNDHH